MSFCEYWNISDRSPFESHRDRGGVLFARLKFCLTAALNAARRFARANSGGADGEDCTSSG